VDFDGNVLLSVGWPDVGKTLPVWSPDGQRFTAVRTESPDNDSVWIFDATTGDGKPAVKFPGRFQLIFRALWAPDGKSVIVNRRERTSHVVLLEDFWP
jgi:dipeptidyl aminopeptidase/acylaminoacyl peptidase